VGGTATIQVYCSVLSRLTYSVTNSRIATLTAGTSSGNYKNYTINGITAGTTTIRFYDKNNSKKYVDVSVTVGGSSEYYTFYNTEPAKKLSTDKVIKIQTTNSYNYVYMLVPEKYDEAYTNTLIAQKFSKYSYYTVYQTLPRQSSTDRYYEFISENNSYYGSRYVLLPQDYDQVKLNTVVAKYNNKFEYYTVYNERPTLRDTWDDVRTWNVYDSTGRTVTRYMLVPSFNVVDESRVQEIINNDMNANNVYSYYTVYTKQPVVNSNSDTLVFFTKSGSPRYMIVPISGADILKRNDAIQKETGTYEPYIMYSTKPTATAGQHISTFSYGGRTVYVLCTYEEGTAEDTAALNNITINIPRGN